MKDADYCVKNFTSSAEIQHLVTKQMLSKNATTLSYLELTVFWKKNIDVICTFQFSVDSGKTWSPRVFVIFLANARFASQEHDISTFNWKPTSTAVFGTALERYLFLFF